ncbi:MAG: xanthine dehydrogenase family protein molybdopterin-binding subunit [Aggregatilineales bacterium]
MATNAKIGQPTPLIDGGAKVNGALRFVADIKVPGMLTMHIIGSDYAHAKIISIDKSAALEIPGVIAVLTADDLLPIAPSSRSHLLLARDRVMFYGQPVALVVATDDYIAADAAEMVWIEYEELPAAISIDAAMADDAPLVWERGVPKDSDDAGAHGADTGEDAQAGLEEKRSNITGEVHFDKGDVDSIFANAEYVVEHTFTTPMVHQSSLETHGIIAQPDRVTGGMTVWASTQGTFGVRRAIAKLLNVPESDVRVIGTPVGGGFGGKFGLYEILTAMAAHALGKTVRLILTRMDEMKAANPAPQTRIHAKLAADSDGCLQALEAHIIVDSGCYPSGLSGFGAFMMGAFYRVPNYRLKATNVVTFKPSAGAYRAPMAPSVTFALDSLIDELAEKIGMDSIEMRLKNVIQQGDELPNDRTMPGIGMTETLQALQNHPLWQNRAQAKAEGRGIGVAIGGWMGAMEPGAVVCQVNRDGLVHVHVGAVDLTGTTTTWAMLAAETFDLPVERIRVVFSGTDTAPYAGGTGGSKTTYSLSSAVAQAAETAKQQALEIASEEFEAAVEDLIIVNGEVQVKGMPDKKLDIGSIAAKTMQFGGKYAPIFAHGRAAMDVAAPGFNAQLVEVAVDEETGEVHVLNHVSVQDVGKALNPMTVEGQMMGGAVQGLGWALYEGMNYDENTGQLLSGTWMDYAVPDVMQSGTNFEAIIVEVPSDIGHLGIRGVGEPPVIPTAAAVANAIAHATGTRISDLPMNPPTVWRALQPDS